MIADKSFIEEFNLLDCPYYCLLEKDWNDALTKVTVLEKDIAALTEIAPPLSVEEENEISGS